MDYQLILEKYPASKDLILNMLHEIQDLHPEHYITEEAMEKIAAYLKLPKSQVYGVVTYYTMLSIKPRGKNIIRFCNSPVCNMLGSENLIDFLGEYLGIKPGETTTDGSFTLEKCECLGRCGKAPSLMINDEVVTGITKENLVKMIEKKR